MKESQDVSDQTKIDGINFIVNKIIIVQHRIL